MQTFPYYLLTRPYAAGTPIWRPTDSGTATMRLGNGILRTRDELGQSLYAIDCRIEAMTQTDALAVWSFIQAHRAATFYWPDAKVGYLSSSLYETWQVQFDPESPPSLVPTDSVLDTYDVHMILLPVLPTVSVPMLVAWWPMDYGEIALEIGTDVALEIGTDTALDIGSGTEILDATGNGHTGTPSQDAGTMGVEGKIGGCLDFNGTTDYVAVADSEDLRLTDGGCIMAWMYADGLGESNEGRIVDKSAAVDAGSGYAFALAASNKIAFRVAGDGEWTLSSASAISTGAWRHVAVSFSAQGRRLYVDGVDVTSSGGTLTRLPPSSTAAMRIGNRAGATDRSFNGKLDDVRIYKRPLCLQEIREIYHSGSGTSEEVVP